MPETTLNTDLEVVTAEAEVIARLARDGVTPDVHYVGDDVGETPAALWFGNGPNGHRLVHVEDLEPRRAAPSIKRGLLKVHTPEALSTYAERHIDHDGTTIWAEIDHGRITVVLNDHYHEDPAPGWADHQVSLQLRRSEEWKAWTDIDGEWHTQEELALFLEEHLGDITDPDGSTLLEVTQTFNATSEATFTSTKRLADGTQQLVWNEDVQVSAGRAQHTAIPTDLTVALRPWVGVDPVAVAGKFRFRISSGSLRLRVDLLRVAEASREAVDQAAIEVGDRLNLPIIEGTPPQPRR